MSKKTLPADFLAALNAGAVPVEAAAAAAATTTVETPAPAPAAVVAGAPAVAAAAPAAAEGDDTPAPVAAAKPAAAAAAEEPPSLVAHLRDDLKAVRAELAASQLEASKLKEQVTTLEASQPKLTAIVKKAAEVMAVALGNVVVGLETMSADALCQYHGQLSAAMAKKYPVGGRAVETAEAAENVQTSGTGNGAARAAAVRSTGIK